MKQLGLLTITIKLFNPQKNLSKTENLPNLIKRDFSATNLMKEWVTNITYIHTFKENWCYLASILDLNKHKVFDYNIGQCMLRQRKPEKFYAWLGTNYKSRRS